MALSPPPLPSPHYRTDRPSSPSTHVSGPHPSNPPSYPNLPIRPSATAELTSNHYALKQLSRPSDVPTPKSTKPGDKLVLDVTTINVSAVDFFTSLEKIVPTARRSQSSCARALSREVAPLLMRSLGAVLELVEVVFNPSWRAVEKARRGLNVRYSLIQCICIII